MGNHGNNLEVEDMDTASAHTDRDVVVGNKN